MLIIRRPLYVIVVMVAFIAGYYSSEYQFFSLAKSNFVHKKIVAIDYNGNLTYFEFRNNGTPVGNPVVLLDSWEPLNPDVSKEGVVVETSKGLHFIHNDLLYQLTNGDDKNPSVASNGTVYFDRKGLIMATDLQGSAIWTIGAGNHPLIAPNGMMVSSTPISTHYFSFINGQV